MQFQKLVILSLIFTVCPLSAYADDTSSSDLVSVKVPAKFKKGENIVTFPADDLLDESSTTYARIWQLKPNPKRATVALALGGGGVRGASHVGVLRALERAQVPIDFIAGTSMGAIVGGLYASGMSCDQIEQIILDKRGLKKACIPLPIPLKVCTLIPKRAISLLGKGSVLGLYNGKKLCEFIDSNIPENQRDLEKFKIKFAAVTSNLLDGKAYVITNGDPGKAIQASCMVPFMFRPIATKDGKLLADGGVRSNLPTYAAKLSKADIVIAVNVNEPLNPVKYKHLTSIFGLLNRTSNMLLEEVDNRQLQYVDVQIRPLLPGVSLYSHKLFDAQKAIMAGELAATKSIPEIEELLKRKSLITEK